MGQGVCCDCFCLWRQLRHHLWTAATNGHLRYATCQANNHSRSVDAHFHNGEVTVSFAILPITAANSLVMQSRDQNTGQLPYVQDQWFLMLCWHTFYCMVHSKCAAIHNWIHNYLNLLVAFLPDWDVVLWQSRAQWSSCTGCSHPIKIYTSCHMIHFARYTTVYYPIFTGDCSKCSHNLSLNEILGQTIYRTWWKINDPFCPTFSWSHYSSFYPVYWPSSTPFGPFSFTSVLAESIWEHSVLYSQSAALGFLYFRQCCLALCQIHCMPPSCLRCRVHYPCYHSSVANFWCPKCIQLHYLHHLRQDGGWFM